MRRGDIILADFSGGRGGEIQKTRPAVVVTNDGALRRENRLQVVPLTGNVGRVYSAEALVTLQGRLCKAMANQLTTIAFERVRTTLGAVTPAELQRVERAIIAQLALPVPADRIST